MRKEKKPPARIRTSNAPTTTAPSVLSGLFQGFSFGAGSSIAHNLFRIPYTGASIHPSNDKPYLCENIRKEYILSCRNVEERIKDSETCELLLAGFLNCEGLPLQL